MTGYTSDEVREARSLIDKARPSDNEVGSILASVTLAGELAARERSMFERTIRIAHTIGASKRQLAEAAGLNRKTIDGIIAAEA